MFRAVSLRSNTLFREDQPIEVERPGASLASARLISIVRMNKPNPFF
jgi:hypothetical protein